jgi:putative sigma-54 modulation protein
MTDLPIHITTHHLSLSEPLRRFARKKIAPVRRFANDALAAEIVLRRHNGATTRFSASARLALPGRDIHGRAIDSNLYVAISSLVSKLGRLLRKRKTRLAKSFAKSRVEKRIGSVQGRRLSVSKDSFDASKDRPGIHLREGGQEMRVFPFRRRLLFTTASAPEATLLSGNDL